MSTDDPFSNDNDKTVLRPIPGGRRPVEGVQGAPATNAPRTPVQPVPPAPEIQPVQARAQAVNQMELPTRMIAGSGINILVECGSSLLMLGSRLRNSISQDQIPQLREQMIQQIRSFEDQARAGGSDQDTVLTARYLLCTYLDEAVLSTPWGGESGWSNQSLLSTFHNETWGGEKFFKILDQRLQSPAQSLEVLELMFVCLAFGFQGKYQLSDRASTELAAIQDSIYNAIYTNRGDFERDLSPHWHGVPDKRHVLVRYLPLWVVAAVLGVLLLVIYIGFEFIAKSNSDPIYKEIEQVVQQQNIQNRQ